MLTLYGDPDIFRCFFFLGGGVLLSLKFFFDYGIFTLAKTVLVKILNYHLKHALSL